MVEVKSTIYDMKKFLDSFVWQDIKGQMNTILEDVKNNLINCKDMDELLRFQGRAEALRDIQLLPEEILAALEEDDKYKAKRNEDEKDNFDELLED